MIIRIGFGVLDRLDRDDVSRLLAQHRYWGGPLDGLLNREARTELFRRRACVDALPQTCDAYGRRAPRRGGRS